MSVATVRTRTGDWGTSRNAARRRTTARPRRAARSTSPWLGPIAGALVVLSAMVLVGGLPTARELAAVQPAAASSVRVAPSDTLWSIAKAHRVPGMTTAETVERIMRLNGLTDATLQAGVLIAVPTEVAPGNAYAQSGSDALPN